MYPNFREGDIIKNRLDFGDLDLIFIVTAVEKLENLWWGTSFFSENTVTNFSYFPQKTGIDILCKSSPLICHLLNKPREWVRLGLIYRVKRLPELIYTLKSWAQLFKGSLT